MTVKADEGCGGLEVEEVERCEKTSGKIPVQLQVHKEPGSLPEDGSVRTLQNRLHFAERLRRDALQLPLSVLILFRLLRHRIGFLEYIETKLINPK